MTPDAVRTDAPAPAAAPTPPGAPIVVITGASSGIGAALAVAYAARGWRLLLTGRRTEALDACAIDCARAQGLEVVDPARLRLAVLDQRDTAAWRREVDALLADWGCPEVVIANAGISHGVDLSDSGDLEVAREVMDVDWLAALATLSPFVSPMRARGRGRLVGVASVAGVRGLPGHAAYCGAKAALIASLESLRIELRGTGVAVVTLSPGYIATPMTARNPFPMPFLMQPQDFARGALRAIDRGRAWATLPWPMAVVAALLRVVPRWLFDAALAGARRKPRRRS